MTRLFYRRDLPMLACVVQEGSNIVIAINYYYQLLLDAEAREGLFNRLMADLERRGGGIGRSVTEAGGGAIVIQLAHYQHAANI